MVVKGTDGQEYDVPDAAYEAIVAEKEVELNRVVAANKAAATRAKNERDQLAEELEKARSVENQGTNADLKAVVDDLYAAWWHKDRDAMQLAIRELKAQLGA